MREWLLCASATGLIHPVRFTAAFLVLGYAAFFLGIGLYFGIIGTL